MLGAISSATLGVSKETPTVYVARTSLGRTLVAEEHTEIADVGGYRQVRSYAGDVQAATVPRNDPSVGTTPPNPYDPTTPLEFVRLVSPSAPTYSAWLNKGNEISGARRSLVEAVSSGAVAE